MLQLSQSLAKGIRNYILMEPLERRKRTKSIKKIKTIITPIILLGKALRQL